MVDEACRDRRDPDVYAIGEVACIEGRTWGLVAPGYTMAEIVVDRLLGGAATFPGADTSTKLKLLGVDVASFGDAFARVARRLEVVYADPVAGAYKKLVMSDDAADPARRRARRRRECLRLAAADGRAAARRRPDGLAAAGGRGTAAPATDLPDAANVCSCNNVSAGAIRCAVDRAGVHRPRRRQGVHQGRHLVRLVPAAGQEAGHAPSWRRPASTVSNALCEHFELSRAQLFDVVRVQGLGTFSEIIERHGTGRGCDICRPVVASILASLGKGHVLDRDTARLQDTNDHVMANLQKDGTYSVVPACARRRDHAAGPDRHRPGGLGLRALHEDHRRPAHRPVRRPHRAAARDLAATGRRRLRVRATPTARRCGR